VNDPVDRQNLKITGQHRAITGQHIAVQNDVTVIITQAYGPKGDNIVGITEVDFDGNPAVTVKLRAGGREGLVHLSPIHGDSRKKGFTDIAAGTRCELLCPVSNQPLDLVGEVEDGSGAKYYAIYLTPQLSRGSMVMVSDLWGHYHSRIIDDFELISAWAASHGD
jgi:ribosomal protein L14